MIDNISRYMENTLGIRGIFKKEIIEKHDIIISILMDNNIGEEDIKNSNFGIHYSSINIPKDGKRKLVFDMLKSYEEEFQKISIQQTRVVLIHHEPPYKNTTVLEPKKIVLPKKVSISEMFHFIDDINSEYPDAVEVSCGSVNLTFKSPIRRLENTKEYISRLQKEDTDYISKRLSDIEELKEYM